MRYRIATLPRDQLTEVLSAPKDEVTSLFIGGIIDAEGGELALIRGDLEVVEIPLSIFRPSGVTAPDFSRFEVDDYGHTVRFGDYEASADFILGRLGG